MMQNLSQMTDVIDPLAAAAKSEPENIGHRVSNCVFLFNVFHIHVNGISFRWTCRSHSAMNSLYMECPELLR